MSNKITFIELPVFSGVVAHLLRRGLLPGRRMPCFQISGSRPFHESVFNNCTYPIRFAVLRYYGCHYGCPITPFKGTVSARFRTMLSFT
jgi:hypothetical protein